MGKTSMVLGGLVDLDQYAVTASGMNKNDLRAVRARSGCIGEELVAFFPQPRYIRVDVVGAKAQVMQPATFFSR